jgi:hypothetical protein
VSELAHISRSSVPSGRRTPRQMLRPDARNERLDVGAGGFNRSVARWPHSVPLRFTSRRQRRAFKEPREKKVQGSSGSSSTGLLALPGNR